MCHSSEHCFNTCPKILDFDSATWHVIFSSLLKAHCSTPHVSQSSSDIPKWTSAQHVHAVLSDDGQSPFDEMAVDSISLESDDMLSTEVENHPDFQ